MQKNLTGASSRGQNKAAQDKRGAQAKHDQDRTKEKERNDKLFWIKVNEAIEEVLRPTTFRQPRKFDPYNKDQNNGDKRKTLTLVIEYKDAKDKNQRIRFHKDSDSNTFIKGIARKLLAAIEDKTIQVPEYFRPKLKRDEQAMTPEAVSSRKSSPTPTKKVQFEAAKPTRTPSPEAPSPKASTPKEVKVDDGPTPAAAAAQNEEQEHAKDEAAKTQKKEEKTPEPASDSDKGQDGGESDDASAAGSSARGEPPRSSPSMSEQSSG